MALSFATDIRPLFRDGDIECMTPMGIELDNPAWMWFPPTREVSTMRCPEAQCLQVNPGRQIGFRFSRSGWTPVTLHKEAIVRALARMPTSQNRDMGHPLYWRGLDVGHPPYCSVESCPLGRDVTRGGMKRRMG